MISSLTLASTLMLSSMTTVEPPQAPDEPLGQIPRFVMEDTDGRSWTRSDLILHEGAILVEFWATWCATCKVMSPMIRELRAEFAAEGFEVLSVSIDQQLRLVERHLQREPMGRPVLWDEHRQWSEWKVREVPAYFLIRDGQIAQQWVGEVSREQLTSWIRS